MTKPTTRRARDAGSGRIVSAADAAARPKETVTESGKNDGLAARVELLEQVIAEAGGRAAYLLNRRQRGLSN